MRRLIFIVFMLFTTVAHAGDWPTGANRGGIGLLLFPGKAPTGIIQGVQVPWAMSVPANYAALNPAPASQCNCRVAPADGDYIISLKKYARATPGTAVAEGTCTVANGQLIGTFAANATYTLSTGDTSAIIAPTADSQASDCHVTIGVAQ